MKLETIKKRPDFLRLRGGARSACESFALETRPRVEPQTTIAGKPGPQGPRFGFTVTKAMGNAVVRNRIRRRLKVAVASLDPHCAKANHDYVLIARKAAHDQPFAQLKKALEQALQRVHHPRSERPAVKPKS